MLDTVQHTIRSASSLAVAFLFTATKNGIELHLVLKARVVDTRSQ